MRINKTILLTIVAAFILGSSVGYYAGALQARAIQVRANQ